MLVILELRGHGGLPEPVDCVVRNVIEKVCKR
jgi:hypothetical protein